MLCIVRVKVTARQSEQIKIIAKGIFVGAEVIAGPHLTNGNKDESRSNFSFVLANTHLFLHTLNLVLGKIN